MNLFGKYEKPKNGVVVKVQTDGDRYWVEYCISYSRWGGETNTWWGSNRWFRQDKNFLFPELTEAEAERLYQFWVNHYEEKKNKDKNKNASTWKVFK